MATRKSTRGVPLASEPVLVNRPLVPASFPLGRAWFVVCCYGQTEKGAAEDITRLGFEAYLPQASRIVVRRGKRVTVVSPIFPGYVFAYFDRERDDWGQILDVDGVLDVLQNNDIPVRVPDFAIARLRDAEVAGVFDLRNPTASYPEGTRIEIMEGPFADLMAKVKSTTAKKRLKVILDSLGVVEIDPSFVRKV